jgi:hypothetical protein
LGAFVALTAILATQHEMWRDEVRAFSVATRTTSWSDLVNHIHQEGHPIIWYAILRIGYALTDSTLVLPAAALLIAAGAAFLVLRFAPFPVWMRQLIVFGAFLGYEFSVSARNYGIGVLFMIAACVLFPGRRERPIRLGIALALLANTSVHAIMASAVLIFVWATDAFSSSGRRALLRPASIAAVLIALGGVGLALWSANPPPDLEYAFSIRELQPDRVLRVILIDPGQMLRGYHLANIAAAGEIPWGSIGLDSTWMSRAIVNVIVVGILFALWRNGVSLLAVILAICGFEVLFRLVYTGALRHEGIVAFLLISICWIAISESPPKRRRWIALALLPMIVMQAAALPFMAWQALRYPASSSKAYAKLINGNPRYRDAILTSDPDYMMEPMFYYVPNRVFMPRHRAFDYRVYFDRGKLRKFDFRLGDLIDVADSLACASGQTVLVAVGYPTFPSDSVGRGLAGYRAHFDWDPAERTRLFARGKLIGAFTQATSDENYSVFEFLPQATPGCIARRTRDG